MGRRYYQLIVEVDDTPSFCEDGHYSTPGVPIVTSIKRLGLFGTLWRRLFGSRPREICDIQNYYRDVVIEIPGYVNAEALLDSHEGETIRCRSVPREHCCADKSETL